MKNCHNCRYLIRDKDRFYNRCKRNRTRDGNQYEFTGIVLEYSDLYQSCTGRNLIHWAPKPTLWERFTNLFSNSN